MVVNNLFAMRCRANILQRHYNIGSDIITFEPSVQSEKTPTDAMQI